MSYVVRAYPVIRPVEELQEFISALSGSRSAETDKFYRKYGVSHESAYLQETAQGPILIVVTLIADEQTASSQFQAASEEFHAWFKAQLLHLTGVDPNLTPLGPSTTEVFSWRAG